MLFLKHYCALYSTVTNSDIMTIFVYFEMIQDIYRKDVSKHTQKSESNVKNLKSYNGGSFKEN